LLINTSIRFQGIVCFSGGKVISKTGRCDIATGANLIAFPYQGVIVEPADLIQITKVIKDILNCKACGVGLFEMLQSRKN